MNSFPNRFIQIYLLIITIFGVTTVAQAQNSVGIRQGNSINDLNISVINYIGDCPDKEWSRPEVNFISSTDLAEDRRVRIYNRSIVGEQIPYTDREYEPHNNNPYISNNSSEPFYIARNDKHSNRALSLLKGKNKMVAIIYDGGRDSFPHGTTYQEVKVYKFTVNLTVNSSTQERHLITSYPSIECEDPDTSLASCPDDEKVKVRYQYCPGSSPRSGHRQVIYYIKDSHLPYDSFRNRNDCRYPIKKFP